MHLARLSQIVTSALMLLAAPDVRAQGGGPVAPSPAPTPEVRTAATVKRTLRPDLGVLTLTVSAVGATPAEAGRRVSTRIDSLRRAIAAIGIPRDSLVSRAEGWWYQPRRLELEYPQRWVREPNQPSGMNLGRHVVDTVYRARDVISVRVRDLRKLGAVIDTAYARGVTEMSGVQFQVTDAALVANIQAEALAEATRLARSQARAIAEASGATLGPVIALSTQDETSRYGYPYLMEVGVTASGGGAGTEVVAPGIPISVTIYGRWELRTP